MKGTWQTTDSGALGPALLVIGAVLLLGSGSAVAAVAEALIGALIAAVVVTVLTAAALGVFLVHHARREIPPPQGFVRELPAAERPEVGRTVPRELHQHYHFHGVDETRVAEILRRGQRPE